MRRLPLASVFFAATVITASGADVAVAPQAPDSIPAATPPSTTEASPTKAPRLFSADVAAKLAASTPKFSAPAAAATPVALNVSPEAAEADKPRNKIIRLPAYIVDDPKLPSIKKHQLLTPKGKLDWAYKRYPGLRIGGLPFLNNDAIALFMMEEELAKERRQEEQELWGVLGIKRPSYFRQNEWVDVGGSRLEDKRASGH